MANNRFMECKKISEPTHKSPKGIQELFEISKITKSGIFELPDNQYSKAYLFSDINYSTQDEEGKEDIFTYWCQFLNSMKTIYKIVIMNKNRDQIQLQNHVLIQNRDDGLDHLREAFNELIEERITEGKQGIIQMKYLVVTVERKNIQDANAYFNTLEASMMSSFQQFGSNLVPLNAMERLRLLADFYRSGDERNFTFDYEDMVKMKRDWKNDICNGYIKFGMNDFRMDKKYCKTLFIKKFPSSLDDKFVTDLTDLPIQMLCTMDIAPVPKEVTVNELNDRHDSIEESIMKQQQRKAKNGNFTLDVSWHKQREKEETEEMMSEVRQNDAKMFFASVTIVISANSEEKLNSYAESIKAIGEGYSMQIEDHWLNQREGLMTALPIGLHYVKTMRTLLTQSLAAFMPFNVRELFYLNGNYFGINAVSKNIIMTDRSQLGNGGGFYFGSSGFGKSMQVKSEISQIKLRDKVNKNKIIILDPQNEYLKCTKANGGEYIDISSSTTNYINPLEIAGEISNRSAFIAEKSEFMLALCEQATGERLTSRHKSIVDRCVRKLYEDAFREGVERTLLDFYNILKVQVEQEAMDLAASLEMFTEGSLNIFTRKSNIDSDSNLITFGLNDLGKELKGLAMLIILEFIKKRTTMNFLDGKSTYVFIDEFHIVADKPFSINYLREYWKIVRKLNGFPTGITQNIIDVAKTEEMKTLIANSEFIVLMKLTPADRKLVHELLDISEKELKYVEKVAPGCGILKFGDKIVPFKNRIHKKSILYPLFETDGNKQII